MWNEPTLPEYLLRSSGYFHLQILWMLQEVWMAWP